MLRAICIWLESFYKEPEEICENMIIPITNFVSAAKNGITVLNFTQSGADIAIKAT